MRRPLPLLAAFVLGAAAVSAALAGGVPSPPNAPANLTVTTLEADGVGFVFDDLSLNETGFVLQWQAGDGGFVDVATQRANRGTITDRFPIPGAVQSYRVVAVNRAGRSVPSNEVTVEVPESFAGPGDVAVFPSQLAFGRLKLGKRRVRVFTIRNVADAELSVRVVSLHPAFDVRPLGFRGSERVEPGRSRQFRVTFRPDQEGPVQGALQIISDDVDTPFLNYAVSGVGRVPPPED